MQVRRIHLDRIASVTRNAKVSPDVTIGDKVICQQGMLIAVKVLTDKYTYNTVENISGRMIRIKSGDILAGVLGHRMALKGYAGKVPESLKVGDTIQILNLGGVLGTCTAANPELGSPFDVEVLGSILTFPKLGDRVGSQATISNGKIQPSDTVNQKVPVVFVSGSSMNSGKTVAATELIRVLNHRGLSVSACKLTGVSLMRDILSMHDAGAQTVVDFTDAGVVSTRRSKILPIARGLINYLAKDKPDLIIAELGDGLLGDYGVDDILSDKSLMSCGICHIICAPDPVATYGAYTLFKDKFGLTINAISGPVTDNAVGRDYITDKLGIAAHNARYDIDKLVDIPHKAFLESK